MTDKLALMSKAKTALLQATTLEEVVKIRHSAKAIRSVLSDTLDARDRALEAGAIELLAEHRAGQMLNALKAERAGGNTSVSVAGACKEANVNDELAKFWQSIASSDMMTEESIEKYVEFVQNSTDKKIIREGITLQGFRKFITGSNAQTDKEKKYEWAVMLLNNGTVGALDAYVEEALKSATDAKAKNLKLARQGILNEGYIPQGKK